MKNQIIRAFAQDPGRLELPPLKDYAETLVETLFWRPDLRWKDGKIVAKLPYEQRDQPMVGWPGAHWARDGRPNHLVHVDRDNNIIDPPDEPELMAQINAAVDWVSASWFEGSLLRDAAGVMEGSIISSMPYTADVEEIFFYYAIYRLLHSGEGPVALIQVRGGDDLGVDLQSLETHLLYGLVRRIREEGAGVDDLVAAAEAELAEARKLPRPENEGTMPLDEYLRRHVVNTD